MADAQTQTLVTAAKCLEACIPPGQRKGVIIYLLSQIINNMTIDSSTTALVRNAACFNACIPPGLQDAIIIYLLLNLSSGGVSSQVTCGSGAPVAAPVGSCGIYYDSDPNSVTAGSIWIWSATLAQWVQRVA